MKTFSIELTEADHKRLMALGGAAWVVDCLDKEKRMMVQVIEAKQKSTELRLNAKALKAKPEVVEALLMDSVVDINNALLSIQYPDGI